MANTLPENGDFETGRFHPWNVQVLEGEASIVLFNRSSQARIKPGVDNGVLLYTRFAAKPGRYTVSVDLQAPEAKYVEDPPNYERNPVVFFLFSSFAQDGTLLHTEIGAFWPKRTQQTFTYSQVSPEGTYEKELRFSFPSDPKGSKGSLFIDNVRFSQTRKRRALKSAGAIKDSR